MQKEIKLNIIMANHKKAIVLINGWINTDTIDFVINKIEGIRKKNNPLNYIFNLEGLEYISSAGIGIFMELYETIENKNGKICFIGMSDSVRRVFELVGFLQYFGDVENMEKAEEYIEKKLN